MVRAVPLTAALPEGGSEAVPPPALALGVSTESSAAQKTPSASKPQGVEETAREGDNVPLGL